MWYNTYSLFFLFFLYFLFFLFLFYFTLGVSQPISEGPWVIESRGTRHSVREKRTAGEDSRPSIPVFVLLTWLFNIYLRPYILENKKIPFLITSLYFFLTHLSIFVNQFTQLFIHSLIHYKYHFYSLFSVIHFFFSF